MDIGEVLRYEERYVLIAISSTRYLKDSSSYISKYIQVLKDKTS